MASHYEAPIRKPLVTGDKSYHNVTVDVAAPVEGVANKQWWIVFGIALSAFSWGVGCIIYIVFHIVFIYYLYDIFYMCCSSPLRAATP